MMIEAFRELAGTSLSLTPDEMLGEILALNGAPSIFQCRRLAELLVERDGPALEGEAIRQRFQQHLDAAIQRRMEQIRSGVSQPEHYIVHAAVPFLKELKARKLVLAILSSTPQPLVAEEAKLLGINEFFGKHIYGGTGDPLLFSKRTVFERLLKEEHCPGAKLLSFGDGPVELRETKALGGVAVGVCSDEFQNGSGKIDPHKREGLFAAGADALIPDYRAAEQLLDFLQER
jgi:FMN phosphatase YigB (HAD superfamily)